MTDQPSHPDIVVPELKGKMKLFADLLLAEPDRQELPQWLAYSKAYDNQNKRSCESGASRLMKKAGVCSYIADFTAKLDEAAELDRPWVTARLQEVAERCMQREAVEEWDPIDKCMKPTGEWTFNAAGATKAIELIGKDLGMFKQDRDGADRLTVHINLNMGNGKVITYDDKPAIDGDVEEAKLLPPTKHAEGRAMLDQLGLTKSSTESGS